MVSYCLMSLLIPKMSMSIQKCHSYAGNLNSETPGDGKIMFLHCGDVLHTYKRCLYKCCFIPMLLDVDPCRMMKHHPLMTLAMK